MDPQAGASSPDHIIGQTVGNYQVTQKLGEGGMGSVVRLKQGEGARRVWAYLAGKCTVKIETA